MRTIIIHALHICLIPMFQTNKVCIIHGAPSARLLPLSTPLARMQDETCISWSGPLHASIIHGPLCHTYRIYSAAPVHDFTYRLPASQTQHAYGASQISCDPPVSSLICAPNDSSSGHMIHCNASCVVDRLASVEWLTTLATDQSRTEIKREFNWD
jgi:hypothetical protein